MYNVIFQVQSSLSGHQTYLDTAKILRPQLDAIHGFISVERFRSLEREPWILSLSKWADEASLVKWRTMPAHCDAQKLGRNGVFDDYRLRVAQVVLHARPGQAEWIPERRTPYRIAQGPARFASVLEIGGADRSVLQSDRHAVDSEWYESLATPGKFVWVIGWQDETAARRWHVATRAMLDTMPDAAFELSLVEVERDYGLYPRDEAPQFFPPSARREIL
ncbi:MAG TPA: antibiotic biosynthesis monooxygenase [Burkholderiaceae bacterium]|nr:antibiotic biosynthesis monooxygenase [Burkholderiaceae bacterium]